MRKTLLVIAALLVAAVIGLQLFLAYGLTDSLRKWVLPMTKERWNLDATIESVSVNLLGGSLVIHGAQVLNPPGFDDPGMLAIRRFKLKIGLPALFRGGIATIEKASIRDASLNIIRNRDGAVNIAPALETIHAAMSNTPASTPGQALPPESARKIPDFMIKQMEVKTGIQYADYKISNPPFRMSLEVQLRLNDIANYGRDDVMSGTINLLGHILSAERKCAFDLNGRISPINDPSIMSFDLTGSIQTIDLNNFPELARRCGFEKGQVSGTMTLYCQRGVFDPEKSILHLAFNKVKLTPELQAQFSGIPFPETFKALVPIKGSLTNPEIDIRDAFMKTLTSKDAFDSLIKGVMEAQEHASDSKSASNAPATGAREKSKSAASPSDLKQTLGGFFDKPASKDK